MPEATKQWKSEHGEFFFLNSTFSLVQIGQVGYVFFFSFSSGESSLNFFESVFFS